MEKYKNELLSIFDRVGVFYVDEDGDIDFYDPSIKQEYLREFLEEFANYFDFKSLDTDNMRKGYTVRVVTQNLPYDQISKDKKNLEFSNSDIEIDIPIEDITYFYFNIDEGYIDFEIHPGQDENVWQGVIYFDEKDVIKTIKDYLKDESYED